MIPSWNPGLRILELDHSGGMIARVIEERRAAEAERTGLHCSTIVNDVMKTIDPATYSRDLSDEQRWGYQEIGNIVEDIIAEGLVRRYPQWKKPEPRLYRGVWCSPDGWEANKRTLHEIKVTWKSEKDFEDGLKMQGYYLQSGEYALAWSAQRILLHVLFINGAYPRGAPIPHPRTFVLKWLPGTLERNDSNLRQHAIDRKMATARELK